MYGMGVDNNCIICKIAIYWHFQKPQYCNIAKIFYLLQALELNQYFIGVCVFFCNEYPIYFPPPEACFAGRIGGDIWLQYFVNISCLSVNQILTKYCLPAKRKITISIVP
jgi:hypothetical protein